MKKIFKSLLILLLCFGFVGCSKEKNTKNDSIKLLKDNGYNFIYEPVINDIIHIYIVNDNDIYREIEYCYQKNNDTFSLTYTDYNKDIFSETILGFDGKVENNEMLSEFEAELKNNNTNYDSFIASLKKLNKNYEKTCEKIITISATYTGPTVAGTLISEKADGRYYNFDVIGKTESGYELNIFDWIITNPSELIADQTSIFNVTYKGLNCDLPIACTTVSEEIYKSQCQSYQYEELARNGDNHKGEKIKFSGKILQVMDISGGKGAQIRLATKGNYDDVVLIGYVYKEGQGRYLENDNVTVYGECNGLYTYEAVSGANVTVPSCNAEYIDMN